MRAIHPVLGVVLAIGVALGPLSASQSAAQPAASPPPVVTGAAAAGTPEAAVEAVILQLSEMLAASPLSGGLSGTLGELDWQSASVDGGSATVTDYETWTVTLSDGTVIQLPRDRNVYTLSQQSGEWQLQSADHPDDPKPVPGADLSGALLTAADLGGDWTAAPSLASSMATGPGPVAASAFETTASPDGPPVVASIVESITPGVQPAYALALEEQAYLNSLGASTTHQMLEGPPIGESARWITAAQRSDGAEVDSVTVLFAVGPSIGSIFADGAPGAVSTDQVAALANIVAARLAALAPST